MTLRSLPVDPRVLFVLTFLVGTSTAPAEEASRDQRAVRLEFDPASGQWKELQAPQPGTAEGDLALARQAFADGDFGKARRMLKKWLKRYGGDHPLARHAKLELARCQHATGNYHKSYEILKELAFDLGSDEVTEQALELQFNIAEVYLAGKKRKWLGMRVLPASDLGIEILDKLSTSDPETTLAERALKTKADYYFDRGDFDLSEDEYARLIEAFPRSRWMMWAHLRRAQAALARFPGTPFDDAGLVEAEERFLRFRGGFPQAAEQQRVDLILEDIRSRRAQKELEVGRYYLKVERPQAARFYFRSVVEDWPGTSAAVRAQTQLASINQLPIDLTDGGDSDVQAGAVDDHDAAQPDDPEEERMESGDDAPTTAN